MIQEAWLISFLDRSWFGGDLG